MSCVLPVITIAGKLLFQSLTVTNTDVWPHRWLLTSLTCTVYTHAANPVKWPVPCHAHPLIWYSNHILIGDHTTVTVPSDSPHELVWVPVPIAVKFVLFHVTINKSLAIHHDTVVQITLYVHVHATNIVEPVDQLLQI